MWTLRLQGIICGQSILLLHLIKMDFAFVYYRVKNKTKQNKTKQKKVKI
jgi:hypothetical protein